MKLSSVIIISLCFFSNFLNAQGENNNWVTRQFVINFNAGEPTIIQKTGIANVTPNSAVSDKEGNLLFYSDGIQVLDRNFKFLPNGLFLKGSQLNAQSSLFIPHPSDENLYYLFTKGSSFVDQDGALQYSLIDKRLNDGFGDIIKEKKNVELGNNQVQMMTSAQGICGTMWLITHEEFNNHFLAYKIDDQGISSPIISPVGPIYKNVLGFNFGTPGVLIISPNSEKIAVFNESNFTIELYNFNRKTGGVSDGIEISLNQSSLSTRGFYSGVFSSDNSKLYLAMPSATAGKVDIFQFDVSIHDRTTIASSKTFIGSTSGTSKGLFQLAPNQKIYFSPRTKYFSLIEFPNQAGLACNFIDTTFILTKEFNHFNFLHNPVKVATPPIQKDSIFLSADKSICNTIDLALDISNMGDNFLWQNGDTNATYQISDAGKYWVTASQGNCHYRDTINIIFEPLALDLPENITVCPNEAYNIDLTDEASTFLWNDGSSSPQINLKNAGTYWVTVSKDDCVTTDTIIVNSHSSKIEIPETITFCEEETASMELKVPLYDLDTGSLIIPLMSGWNYLTIPDENCILEDSLLVTVEKLTLELGTDTTICTEIPFLVNPSYNKGQLQWQDGSISNQFSIESAGIYSAELFTETCTIRDSIEIKLEDCKKEECNIFIPNVFSPNEDGQNESFQILSNCDFADFQLSIEDRWGNQVFYTDNPKASWDGIFNNQRLENGVYLVKLIYQFPESTFSNQQFSSITLIK